MTITVSRETGMVVDARRAEVPAEDFRRVCREMMKHGGKEGREIRDELMKSAEQDAQEGTT